MCSETMTAQAVEPRNGQMKSGHRSGVADIRG
jgi:hypothetical protein